MKNTRIIYAGYLLFGFSFILLSATSEPFFALIGLVTIIVGIKGRIRDANVKIESKHWLIIIGVCFALALLYIPLLLIALIGASIYLMIIPTSKSAAAESGSTAN